LQINLLYTMNYPLISEYVEAIKLAEDNFEELSYLRPVLDAEGQPVMSSGNPVETRQWNALKCSMRID